MDTTKRAQARRAINRYKNELTAKAKDNGGVWENFGQKELLALKTKWGDEVARTPEYKAFAEWCNAYATFA